MLHYQIKIMVSACCVGLPNDGDIEHALEINSRCPQNLLTEAISRAMSAIALVADPEVPHSQQIVDVLIPRVNQWKERVIEDVNALLKQEAPHDSLVSVFGGPHFRALIELSEDSEEYANMSNVPTPTTSQMH